MLIITTAFYINNTIVLILANTIRLVLSMYQSFLVSLLAYIILTFKKLYRILTYLFKCKFSYIATKRMLNNINVISQCLTYPLIYIPLKIQKVTLVCLKKLAQDLLLPNLLLQQIMYNYLVFWKFVCIFCHFTESMFPVLQ